MEEDDEETVKKSTEEVKDSDGEAELKRKAEGGQVEFTQITDQVY